MAITNIINERTETEDRLGSELVTNGNFETDSNWTKGTGWSISNGKAVGSNSSSSLYQATGSNYTSGKTYKIVFTVSDYVSGSVRPEITNIAGDYVTSNGTFTQHIVATSSAIGEELKGASFTGSIDNISVKEVGVDREAFSNETNQNGSSNISNIVNERTETEDELGSELVTNGDFSNGLNNWAYQGDSITIVDGAARINRLTNVTFIRQNVLTSGKTYLVEFDVLDKEDNSGTFSVRLGSNNVYNVSTYAGTRFSKYIVSTGVDFRIYSSTNNGVIYVDNVSVKQVDVNTESFTNETNQNGVSVINNTVNQRVETDNGSDLDLFGNDMSNSNIVNTIVERVIGLTYIQSLINALRDRADNFENEQCTKDTLTNLENI